LAIVEELGADLYELGEDPESDEEVDEGEVAFPAEGNAKRAEDAGGQNEGATAGGFQFDEVVALVGASTGRAGIEESQDRVSNNLENHQENDEGDHKDDLVGLDR
jgi:hypothetical protein